MHDLHGGNPFFSLLDVAETADMRAWHACVQDIFRRYPNRFESVISELCAALEVLEEPDAKAAMVWIIGEFAHRIDNADELLSYLLDNFLDEPVPVQLQLLTAAVKLFLKRPGLPEAQTMISTVLTAATQQSDNPDLRDRAFLYWRLLSSLPEVRTSAPWRSMHAALLTGLRSGVYAGICRGGASSGRRRRPCCQPLAACLVQRVLDGHACHALLASAVGSARRG